MKILMIPTYVIMARVIVVMVLMLLMSGKLASSLKQKYGEDGIFKKIISVESILALSAYLLLFYFFSFLWPLGWEVFNTTSGVFWPVQGLVAITVIGWFCLQRLRFLPWFFLVMAVTLTAVGLVRDPRIYSEKKISYFDPDHTNYYTYDPSNKITTKKEVVYQPDTTKVVQVEMLTEKIAQMPVQPPGWRDTLMTLTGGEWSTWVDVKKGEHWFFDPKEKVRFQIWNDGAVLGEWTSGPNLTTEETRDLARQVSSLRTKGDKILIRFKADPDQDMEIYLERRPIGTPGNRY